MAKELIDIPKIMDARGNLSFIEHGARGICPFEIERVYWVYDVPTGEVRHGRALRHTAEMIVAMSGSFTVKLTRADGLMERHTLTRSDRGLLVEPGTWREICDFSTNSVAMVLASGPHDPDEYIYDIKSYLDEYSSADKTVIGEKGPKPELNRSRNVEKHEGHGLSRTTDCHYIELPRVRDPRGSLTVAENGADDMPFDVRRVFYLYDVPADADRGGHSHYMAREMIVALTGSFDVVIDDGETIQRFSLNRPYKALYIPRGLWRTLDNFSGGAVALVLTSERFAEADYVRDYATFKKLTADGRK